MVIRTQRLQKTRTGLRAVRVAPPSLPPLRANDVIRGRRDTPSETLAKSLIKAVAGSGEKLRRRSRAGLRAAIEILGTETVDGRDVAGIIRSMPDTPHLRRLRAGHVSDEALWADIQEGYKSCMQAPVTPISPRRLGTTLAVAECMLRCAEVNRWAVLHGDFS